MKTCYEDFDRHNMGFVTLSQVRMQERGRVWVCGKDKEKR